MSLYEKKVDIFFCSILNKFEFRYILEISKLIRMQNADKDDICPEEFHIFCIS